jgi:hypothetical protein
MYTDRDKKFLQKQGRGTEIVWSHILQTPVTKTDVLSVNRQATIYEYTLEIFVPLQFS